LPKHLFLTRWCKDPSDSILVQKYRSFYNSDNIGENLERENTNHIIEEEDYEYLLNRIWYKVQQIVKAKRETAKNFYLVLDKSVKEEISYTKKSQNCESNKKINNPVTIKPKGNIFFKYLFLYIFNLLTYILNKDVLQKKEIEASLKLPNLLKDRCCISKTVKLG
jgi:hypothetical protein